MNNAFPKLSPEALATLPLSILEEMANLADRLMLLNFKTTGTLHPDDIRLLEVTEQAICLKEL